MTDAAANALARQIASASSLNLQSNVQTACWIRTIHRLPDGAEALRLIVRDDLQGAGSAVADALWSVVFPVSEVSNGVGV
jgi:hypothetical protein